MAACPLEGLVRSVVLLETINAIICHIINLLFKLVRRHGCLVPQPDVCSTYATVEQCSRSSAWQIPCLKKGGRRLRSMSASGAPFLVLRNTKPRDQGFRN
jgi:hypothetical protein